MYPYPLENETNDVTLQYKNPLREESHPELAPDFPYKYIDRAFSEKQMGAPWHWHTQLEIFYMEKGDLLYRTPGESMLFLEGTGGLINANVLHRTRIHSGCSAVSQKIHIFSPSFLGEKGSRIYQRYMLPVLQSPQTIFPFSDTENALVRSSFLLTSDSPGYELKLREVLSQLVLTCYEDIASQPTIASKQTDHKLLGMIAFIEEHLSEKLSVSDIAGSVYISERDCYRRFRSMLDETPQHFLQSMRLEKACQLLKETDLPVHEVAARCGMDSSYFSVVFSRSYGQSPSAYRLAGFS